MGTEGMSFSLQSRDLIADSIETVMAAQWYDANISIPGCDKNMPGCIMAMGRLNRPVLMIYGGTIRAGHLTAAEAGHNLRIPELWRIPCRQRSTKSSGRRSCAMPVPARALAAECTPPIRWRRPSRLWGCRCLTAPRLPPKIPQKLDECFRAGAAIRNLLELDLKPRDIMTREAFENAMVVVCRARRVDQRGAASDCHGAIRQCAADHRRFPEASATGRRCWPTSSPAALM